MLLPNAACLFTAFILHISGVQGQADSICALEGTSVALPCSYPTSSETWHTVHWDGQAFVLNDYCGDSTRYNISKENNFTLTIDDLRESDTKFYCCGNITYNPGKCWISRAELHVTDLQVKVIPTTDGQKVSLICSTNCPLTENPAAYIWYRNSEFLYQDWSPWYQELVSSEEAVRYSCAIKGYEDLRAPEVSVDSITPACFAVTYAKGRMCSWNHVSTDEPCSITFPTEVHIQRTPLKGGYVRLTCTPSCPLTDPQTAYRWYLKRRLYRLTDSQHLTVPSSLTLSCAVKHHEDLHTTQVCSTGNSCQTVNYVSRRICALQGSSVNITSEYSNFYGDLNRAFWYKIKRSGKEDAAKLTEDADHLKYHYNTKNQHILRIKNVRMNDSADYVFSFQYNRRWFDSPGVTLVVTGLKVTLTPSAVVTKGQRVTLSCSTSCPLTDDTNYIWYFNSRPLTRPENQNKYLVLDPVSSQHAGNYSCTVKTQKDITSPEKMLTVEDNFMTVINAVRLIVALLIPTPLLIFHLWLRWNYGHTRTSQLWS